MNFNLEDLISISEVSKLGLSKLVAEAEEGRTRVVLRNNEAVAAIVNIHTVERLQRLEELESDLRLLSIALVRTVADSGRRYSLDEVTKELGFDPGDDLHEH